MKKTSLYILMSFILVNFLLPTGIILNNNEFVVKKNIVYGATENWYYTVQPYDEKTETGGYSSQKLCLDALKKVHPSNNPSSTCYLGENVLISSFSPESGKKGDTITIIGKNFIGIENISFGNINVKGLMFLDSSTKIRVIGLPPGVETGKITIKTQSRGSATSSKDFIVSKDEGMRWWYYNNTNQIMGPGRRETIGFSDSKTCEESKLKFISDSGSIMNLGSCFQETIVKVEEIVALEKKAMNNNDVVGFDPKKDDAPNANSEYTLLAPIPGMEVAPKNIGDYFNILFKIAIGICAVLAVVMIVIGGIQYMGDESVFGKTEAKSQITKAILGLLIAIGSYALLNTINPAMLGKEGLNIKQLSMEIDGDVNAPVSINASNTKNIGIKCNDGSDIPTIARSFKGKMTYSQDLPKGQISNNLIKNDCSGFVNMVIQCSGAKIPKINSGTSVIFSISEAEKVDKSRTTATSINGKELIYGDLVGWKPTDDKGGNGHVMIYIGNGLVADSHAPRNILGKAYGEFSLMKYKDRITYFVRTVNL